MDGGVGAWDVSLAGDGLGVGQGVNRHLSWGWTTRSGPLGSKQPMI